MALTKVSTDGVKDDAITKAKIPANQIEASELADNAVDTNAIANSAVNVNKIADNAVTTAKILNNAVNVNKIVDNAVIASKILNNNVTTDKIADQAVTLAKLPHGTSSNDGKFLRANNGADPTFESLPASGVTVSNNANNRVVTGDGTNLNAEAALTFDGTNFNFSRQDAGDARMYIYGGEGGDARLLLASDEGDDHIDTWEIRAQSADNNLSIYQFGGGSYNKRLSIDTDQYNGNVKVHTGNLVIGTSGKGIDFSAASGSNSGATSSILDDYEEGSFTTDFANGANYAIQTSTARGQYVKIGQMVYVRGYIRITSVTNGQSWRADVSGLPFTSGSFDNLNMPMSVIGLSWSYGSGQSGLVGEVLGSSTHLRVRNARYDGHGYIVTANNMTNSSRIWFSGSYRVA